jgi:hypothetical protein
MIDLLIFALTLFSKYILMFSLFLLIGRSFVMFVDNYLLKHTPKRDVILGTRAEIIYPLIGLAITGNLLIFLNYFVELKNPIIYFFLVIALVPNLLSLRVLTLNIANILNTQNIFLYLIIPGILLISSSDINFHYDAAYYHLNHQNWLRESNLIVGTVNIFWPFGMSSIFEYLSSILWVGESLIYLHFLNITFIHVFFSFIFYHLHNSENRNLKNASWFLLLFSVLDNFGISGGRNGFIYIQEIGKQDTAVATLFCLLSILLLDKIQKKNSNKPDFVYLSILVFFIFEIKVSGVIIFLLYFIYLYGLIVNSNFKIKQILYLQLPTIFFGLIWSIKSILTTGCLIFPLSFTCNENFWWYEQGSTERVEEYTTATSFSYMEYFTSRDLNFFNWVQDFFFSESNSTFSNFYLSVYTNFLISLLILYIVKITLFTKSNVSIRFKGIIFSYALLGVMYLVFYGPIPRYSMGILCTIICTFGFFTETTKIKTPKYLGKILFLAAISLFPRVSSYQNFINNKDINLFDPRVESQYIDISTNNDWVKPDSGDRCWINLNCTMEEKKIIVNDDGYFKFAYKEE